MNSLRWMLYLLLTVLVTITGCASTPPKPASGHIDSSQRPDASHLSSDAIPSLVREAPVVPEPTPAIAQETYTVVVTNAALDELLFALARDAHLNIDVHPGLSGKVTLNAIDQTLLQILDRISAQVPVRYHFEDELLVVEPDQPYLRSYYIDYVNLARSSKSNNSVSTEIATTGQAAVGDSGGRGSSGGSNSSSTNVTSSSENQFWGRLRQNIASMLGLKGDDDASGQSVIINAETGLITILATQTQHLQLQEYLDRLVTNAQRQVLIEATVVEVELNNNYQFGVDWSKIADSGNGVSFTQSLLGTNLASPPVFSLNYTDNKSFGNISATVKMLQEFGNVKVLSSPKIMAINNQTALLKVVDNIVYFTLEADTVTGQTTTQTTFTSTPHTVPVGFVMSVTPQISREDAVTLNVRPTISRVTGFVNDPNPALAANSIESRIPQIQVREMESVLRVRSGQIAVLGGLIQDNVNLTDQGIPVLSQIDYLGDAFTYRDNKIKKSELVIFLRPRVVDSLDKPLDVYTDYLPNPDAALGPDHAGEWRVMR
ncbi:general secretion pathway protein D [Thiogranum longum]|uniref:General secretion pathway protein D n=1 Tax=Thiogranum longum TaxID=1537524 RepID=A0A4V2PGH7_9GAMM|nr:pilus (MSHA type) biogenesis protein MshL [Thiogranum longum]TCK16856.1 general secretion pathway protein D [Thiogranum longum]